MRLVIQRVSKASVAIDNNQIVGEIDKGLFILVGIKKGDTPEKADCLAEKLLKLRVMSDDKGKMNLNVVDSRSSVLIVSQFTLYANTNDGNRPSFIDAEEPDKAESLYNYFLSLIKESNVNVQTGKFGNYMKIDTILDGPVTIILEK